MSEQVRRFSGANKQAQWGQALRAAAGLPRGKLWKETAPPQTRGKRCARALAGLLLGFERPFSPSSLSFPSSMPSAQRSHVWRKEQGDCGAWNHSPVSPGRVLGSGVCRKLSPGPRRRRARLQVAGGAVQHSCGAGGSPEPRAPQPRGRAATGLSPGTTLSSLAASRPWARSEPPRPRPRRALRPASCSGGLGASTLPLPSP